MKWLRMEMLTVVVRDLDQAIKDFGELFGLEFVVSTFPHDHGVEITAGHEAFVESGDGVRMAVDRNLFFELCELPEDSEGVRSIHFKVDSLDEATDILLAHGLTLVTEYAMAGPIREGVFTGEALHGVRLAVMEYDDPLLGA